MYDNLKLNYAQYQAVERLMGSITHAGITEVRFNSTGRSPEGGVMTWFLQLTVKRAGQPIVGWHIDKNGESAEIDNAEATFGESDFTREVCA